MVTAFYHKRGEKCTIIPFTWTNLELVCSGWPIHREKTLKKVILVSMVLELVRLIKNFILIPLSLQEIEKTVRSLKLPGHQQDHLHLIPELLCNDGKHQSTIACNVYL